MLSNTTSLSLLVGKICHILKKKEFIFIPPSKLLTLGLANSLFSPYIFFLRRHLVCSSKVISKRSPPHPGITPRPGRLSVQRSLNPQELGILLEICRNTNFRVELSDARTRVDIWVYNIIYMEMCIYIFWHKYSYVHIHIFSELGCSPNTVTVTTVWQFWWSL